MEFVLTHAKEIVEVVTMLVGAFAIIATMTPNESDNKVVALLLKLVNLLGANVGNAENK